jgi:uncharacterized membrane protein HdeD (DUF308 family)
MEAGGLESAHIYRPSKKARTFFAVMGCLSFLVGVWLLSRCIPECLVALTNNSFVSQQVISSLMVIIGAFLVVNLEAHARAQTGES